MKRPPYTIYEFEDPLKPELEEWLVIDHRLREVADALKHVHGTFGRPRKAKVVAVGDTTATRSHYCFATVTYMRCFSSGRHRRLSIDSIKGLTATNRATHIAVKDIRNTFFAHAVADNEGEHVYLHAPIGGSINGFTTISIIMLCDSKQTVRNFINLVAKVRKHVNAQAEALGDRIAARIFGSGASWRQLSKVAMHHGKRA